MGVDVGIVSVGLVVGMTMGTGALRFCILRMSVRFIASKRFNTIDDLVLNFRHYNGTSEYGNGCDGMWILTVTSSVILSSRPSSGFHFTV